MRLHRFIGDFDFAAQRVVARDPSLAGQLKNVLRLAPGDAVVLCDGKERDARATIAAIGKATVDFDVVAVEDNRAEPDVAVTLYCAVLKRENFELAAQKAVEAGVSTIVPVVSRRTVKLDPRRDRALKIMKEAAEQSGRGIVPALAEPLTLPKALAHAEANGLNLFFELGAPPVAASVPSKAPARIGVFIGPEGGWEPDETALAKDAGCAVVGLGARTLRAETAAIVAVYLAVAAGEPGAG
jgi:16S rRNA (uracil1498-N3)-methyltransferase